MVLSELEIPYEIIPISFEDVKKPEYLKINPNGRIPAIRDPNFNKDLTLWESGAILEYIIEQYDKDHRLSFAPDTPEFQHARQWLFFQVSGQGPYYGQAAWFKKFHAEQLPSAKERYNKEVARVSGVLDGHLAREKEKYGIQADAHDGPWLVGNKFSFADIAFISWQTIIGVILERDEYNGDDFPHVKQWLANMTSRKAIKTVLDSAFAASKAAQ